MTRRTRLHALALGVTVLTTVPALALLCRGRTPAQYAVANLPPWERKAPLPANPRVRYVFPLADPATWKIGGTPALRAALHADENALFRPLETPTFGQPHGDAGQAGTWLEAACALGRGDSRLRAKQDRVATRLMNAQDGDGYLGPQFMSKPHSQTPPSRAWDAHCRNLRGLLAYYTVSHSPAAVYAAMQAGDLLVSEAQADPSCRLGEAVLPLARLYLATHQPAYLALAARTAETGQTEPLGLCALYEDTGDVQYLAQARQAWDTVPSAAASAELLTLTGETRYARGIEKAPEAAPWRAATLYTRAPGGVAVNGLAPGSQAVFGALHLTQAQKGPAALLTVTVPHPTSCVLRILTPTPNAKSGVWVNGNAETPPQSGGYLVLRRRWKSGDVVKLLP